MGLGFITIYFDTHTLTLVVTDHLHIYTVIILAVNAQLPNNS